MLSEVVRHLLENDRDCFGSDSKPEIEVVNIIRYTNSLIARLFVKLGHEEKILIVKMLYPDQVDGRSNKSDMQYKEEQIKTEYEVLEKLYHAFVTYPDLGVIKPVAYYPEYLSCVTEEQKGRSFSSEMGNIKIYASETSIKKMIRWVNCSGKWLRLFQSFIRGNSTERYDFKEDLDYCDIRLNILSVHRPEDFTEEFCVTTRDYISDLAGNLKNERLEIVGRHNDYGPNNMIVSGEKLILLDFAGFNFGPVYRDYVKFWSELDLARGSLFVSNKTVDKLQEAFIRGYGRKFDADDPHFVFSRIAYILDKMGDIWEDWDKIPWIRRPGYKKFYRKSLTWLKSVVKSGNLHNLSLG